MAPEVALDKIESLTTPGAVVLDPMCGSGTVPRLAGEEGRRPIASDVDPLAVMITRTACKPAWSDGLLTRAKEVITASKRLRSTLPPWIARDDESREFVEYWFDYPQRMALSQIAKVLSRRPSIDDPLRIALSRLIVTKEGGASLARDTSHSRPHRVQLTSDFDVHEGFLRSAERIQKLLGDASPRYQTSVRTADARALTFLKRGSVDLVVTSPPYLNAIDYIRGHRLSLVWFGYPIGELRELRSGSIGAVRGLHEPSDKVVSTVSRAVPGVSYLSVRDQRMVWRFAKDLDRLCRSLARVTRAEGHLVFVVADSQLKGVSVSNSSLCRLIAQQNGFIFEESVLRPLPAHHRYLPPPGSGSSTLSVRMREEVVLTFQRAA